MIYTIRILRELNIVVLCVVLAFFLSCKSYAADEGSISDAFISCIESTLAVADQALETFEEAQAEAEKAAELKRQHLDELGYPDGYDPDDPVGMGEVDPYDVMTPDMDEIMKQEAMDAMNDYYYEKPDISDRVIKP